VDNRTIRRALTRRVPEVYFVHHPIMHGKKVYWRLLANINGKLYKILADMPKTALISHKELLNTMVSEVYDEVQAIKCGSFAPDLLDKERDWTPLSAEDARSLGIGTIEDLIADNPNKVLEMGFGI
jgi:hypothetical protein